MKRVIILFVAILLLCQYLHAQTWNPPAFVVGPYSGTGGRFGEFPNLLVVNGNPAMVAYDGIRGSLIFIRATDASGTSWGAKVPIDVAGNVGLWISMQIVNGNPAISYYDGTYGDLKYVRALDINGTAWATPITIDFTGNVGQYTSLQVVNNNPAISYYDATSQDLKYVRATDANGTAWASPIIIEFNGNVGQWTSLKVVNGNPAISYYISDPNNSNLKYVRSTDVSGTTWATPLTLDFSAFATKGQNSSLQIVNGNPAISYYDASGGDLKYIRATDISGNTWATPVIADGTTGSVGQYTSLQIVNNNPAISYYDGGNQKLKYVRASDVSGTAWATPVIADASSSLAGYYTSLQIVNNNPAIAHFGGGDAFDLKFVRSTDINGIAWGVPISFSITGDIGQWSSLQVVNGNPAISFYNATFSTYGHLQYVRATDASGTTWGAPVIADIAFGEVGKNTSLQMVSGNPAISYFANGNLKYVRATNATGTTWGTPVSIDFYGLTPEPFNSLQIVNGNPAIVYYSASGSLKYVRANDASGTTWPTAITLDATGLVGLFNSLEIVNGNPAISYYDYLGAKLKYIRANDVSGTTWAAPVTVDAIVGMGYYTSLRVINGNPAISYSSGNSLTLRYVRATDVNGTAWGTPVSVDLTAFVGYSTSLQVVNNNPAISYYDATNKDLKYVRANDASGTSWATPVILDAAGGDVGSFTSMQIVNGNPAISYYDFNAGLLKYISAINPSSISVNPGVSNVCAGTGFSVNYTSANTVFNAGNVFTVQLSNGSGSFSSPVNIGTLNSTSTSGAINVIIPSNTSTGNNYLIRVNSSNPVITGNTSSPFIINAIPTAATISAGGVTTFCQGGTVTLTSNATSGNQWYKDGVAIGGSTATTYIANTSGNYTVKVTVSGCESLVSNAIVVTVNSGPPAPTIIAGSTTSFCIGGSVTLTSNAASGNQWYKDGVAIGGSTATSYIASTSGSYTVKVTVSGCVSGASNAIVVVVTSVPSTPTISAGGVTTFCQGGTVTLTSNAASGNQWYKDGVVIGGSTATSYIASTSGNYTVKVVLGGCESIASNAITVTVNPGPPAPTISAGSAISFCIGGSVTLTSNTASGNQWYKDGVVIGGSTATNYIASTSGSYTVKVTVSSCESGASNAIVVVVTSVPSTPTISAGGVTTFCQGGTVTLTSNAASGNQWYKDGVVIGGSTSTTYLVNTSGNYTVKVILGGCESITSNAIAVTVNSNPATPTITQNANQLVSSAASGNQWYLNSVIIAGATSQNFTPLTNGNYTVQVSANNCSSSFSNAFNFTITGIPNINVFGNLVNVFPSPVNDILIITSTGSQAKLNIRLFDISGKQLKLLSSNQSRIEINMTKYTAGVYFIWIEDSRSKVQGKKIILKQ